MFDKAFSAILEFIQTRTLPTIALVIGLFLTIHGANAAPPGWANWEFHLGCLFIESSFAFSGLLYLLLGWDREHLGYDHARLNRANQPASIKGPWRNPFSVAILEGALAATLIPISLHAATTGRAPEWFAALLPH